MSTNTSPKPKPKEIVVNIIMSPAVHSLWKSENTVPAWGKTDEVAPHTVTHSRSDATEGPRARLFPVAVCLCALVCSWCVCTCVLCPRHVSFQSAVTPRFPASINTAIIMLIYIVWLHKVIYAHFYCKAAHREAETCGEESLLAVHIFLSPIHSLLIV